MSPDLCPVCDERPSEPAFSGCCSVQCERELLAAEAERDSLRAQVARLERERDEARAEAARLRKAAGVAELVLRKGVLPDGDADVRGWARRKLADALIAGGDTRSDLRAALSPAPEGERSIDECPICGRWMPAFGGEVFDGTTETCSGCKAEVTASVVDGQIVTEATPSPWDPRASKKEVES